MHTSVNLNVSKPSLFSVTSVGSTEISTVRTVLALRKRGTDIAPHLSLSKRKLLKLLDKYCSVGVTRIVALLGDYPKCIDLRFAKKLIDLIRKNSGDHFELIAAAYTEMHPQSTSLMHDIRSFAEKLRFGVDKAITQYLFEPNAYLNFVELARNAGIEQPIVPGIMPLTNYSRLARFSNTCGATITRWVSKQISACGDRAFGQEVVTLLCSQLISGSVHLYTLNNAAPSIAILDSL